MAIDRVPVPVRICPTPKGEVHVTFGNIGWSSWPMLGKGWILSDRDFALVPEKPMTLGAQAVAGDSAEGTPKPVFDWGFLAKGIAIILVVAGHFRPTWAPSAWLGVVDLLYEFHIPAFFLVAGLFHNPQRSFLDVMRRKVYRLALPYLSIAGMFILVKLLVGLFVPLETTVSFESITALLLKPEVSFAPFLWFLLALMMVFAGYSLLHAVVPKPWFLFTGVLLLRLAPLSMPRAMDLMVDNLPWFALGVALKGSTPFLYQKSSGLLFVAVAVFGLANLGWSLPATDTVYHALVLVQGISGGLFVVLLSMAWERHPFGPHLYRWVRLCGQASMVVYILHTPFQSAVRILYSMSGMHSIYLLWIAIGLSALAGVLCPLWIDRLILVRVQPVRRILLGEA